ncbi:MAG: acyl-CoA dehydrogenase family protein [Desulfobacteraceae bacterium]|nr:acyl-CoA dehydrogenase family protein [Desulfobacteraceae bacterium]
MSEIENLSEEIKLFLETKTADPKNFFGKIFSKYCSKHALSHEFGGIGGQFSDIYKFTRETTSQTANIGISLSILINMLILKIISLYGNNYQKEKYLKNAIEKGLIFSFAVSEPQAGPHPKFLKSCAEKKADDYFLSGEKTFTTNAPVCDFALIIAITSVDDKKRYSAFFMPSENDNVWIEEIKNLPFFKDCPHGTIGFDSFKVSENEIFGEKNKAYDQIVMSFRKFEDILMAGPVLGAMEYLIHSILRKNKNLDSNDFYYETGAIIASIKSLDFLCEKACEELETSKNTTEFIHLFFREEIKSLIERIENLCQIFQLNFDSNEKQIMEDLSGSGKIAFKAAWNKLVKLAKNESL